MRNDALKKKIDCLRDAKNHLWTGLVVSISGVLGLSFSVSNFYKFILICAGIIFIIIFFFAYFQKDNEIEKLINKLEKENINERH